MAELNIDKMAQYVAQKAMEKLKDDGIFIGSWIHVSEGMPLDGQDVLFCDTDGDIFIGYHYKDGPDTHFTRDGSFEVIKNVKYWMPLPEKPSAESKEDDECPEEQKADQ